MVLNFNIAIDGPAGAGKSTVAKLVAGKLGFTYIDTGAMYRAIALQALNDGVSMNDASGLVRSAKDAAVNLKTDPGGEMRVLLNGKDVTEQIRAPEVSRVVSLVARIPEVRKQLITMQKAMAAKGGVVMEGRDIGTSVLPEAKVKVFLYATPQERARRRREELAQKGCYIDSSAMEAEIAERDRIDSSRKTNPLIPAPDAELIDCSFLTVEQVVNIIIKKVLQG
ncbi:MAG: Cytidylate kinase [Pelotomaculum thermopropionicum]|uniref:Cytidylate kinase n=1 Tax=Pelotomaculum thermopropionicum TaxID=110500 RepID=A0A101HTW9_9FIRM|nr:MAG: Cytidylate kinase [Pelotomaculum thermopropionicum]